MTHLIALLDTAVGLGLTAEVRRVVDLFDSWAPALTDAHQTRVRLALVPFFAAIHGAPVSAAHVSWEQVQAMQEDLRTNPTLPYFGLHAQEFTAVATRVRAAVAPFQQSVPYSSIFASAVIGAMSATPSQSATGFAAADAGGSV
jgi:hypothetical protein